MSHFDLMEVKEGRRVIEHNSNSRSRRESSNTRILDSVQNASMVSDSDAIVGFDERDVDHPETGVLATPSLSTRQPPETQIRWWPELDRLLVARRPPPKPNPRFMRRNDPRGGAGPNGNTPPTPQCPCRSSHLTDLDSGRLDSRELSYVQPPPVETLHRLDHGRSHPQTHPHRSRSARDAIHHTR